MKKILIVDTNYGFTSDVESRLILDEIDNVEITTRNRLDYIHDDIASINPDELLIAAHILSSHPSWDFGIPIKTYAKDSAGLAASNDKGFPCYGIVKNAGDLISAIEQNKIVKIEQKAPQNIQPPIQAEPIQSQPVNIQPQPQTNIPMEQPLYQTPQKSYQNQMEYQNPNQTTYSNPPGYQTPQNPSDFVKNNRDAVLAALLSGQGNRPQQNPVNNGYNNGGYNNFYNGYNNNGYNGLNNQNEYNQGCQNGYDNMNGYSNQYGYNNYINNKNSSNNYERAVLRDMRMIKQPAKVISSFSAKGGVGKTTISCELATFLSLTSNGRKNFKTCLVDFNIDFGNVINTLDFDPRKACMTLWASDIKERVKCGENPDDINYTEAQIESFLQKKDKDGLYALLAPLTNADSMLITALEVKVMLRNLIHNGGFDFVICDTGNNTRDTTCIALEYSDEVFMILTQSVNTANANQSFLKTMMSLNFDMSKIKTIINMTKSEKDVGATVKEVENALINPTTGRPFECVARIKDSNAVRNSENIGEPLVYNATHEFTRSIAELAKYVIGNNFVLPELPKRNLFVDLFNKLKK